MRKIRLFIAQTLDGYIATKDESLQWLFDVEGDGDNGYGEFMQHIDTVVMGKRTYDWVMEHEKGVYPYTQLKSVVFSRSGFVPPEGVSTVSGSVQDWADSELTQDGKDIWVVGGGEVIQQFLEANLVDELIITTAPVLLGDGIRLFSPGTYEKKLKLLQLRTFGQFAESTYRVIR